jgi:hypothetical protein
MQAKYYQLVLKNQKVQMMQLLILLIILIIKKLRIEKQI